MSNYLDTNQNMKCLNLNTGGMTCSNLHFNNLTCGTLETTSATIPNIVYTNITTGGITLTSLTSSNLSHTIASTGSLVFSDTLNFHTGTTGVHTINIVKIPTVIDSTTIKLASITTGLNDGGGYTVKIWGCINHGGGSVGSGSTCSSYFESTFSRAMLSSGTGVSSTPTNILGPVVATSTARDIISLSVTTVETTEFQTDVQIIADLGGTSVTTAVVSACIQVISHGFLTPPIVS